MEVEPFEQFCTQEFQELEPNGQNNPKYRRVTLADKVEIIGLLDTNHQSNSSLAARYNVSRATVSYISKHKDKFMDQARLMSKNHHSESTWKLSPKYLDIEQALYEWYTQKDRNNEPVSSVEFQRKARQINAERNGSKHFQASPGWLHRFKLRYGITKKQVIYPKLRPTPVAIQSGGAMQRFDEPLNTYVTEKGFDVDQIYNAYETCLNWNSLPSKSSKPKEADKVTLIICTNISGTHKLPIMIVGKSKNTKFLNDVRKYPVIYRSDPNPRISRKIFEEWFEGVLSPYLQEKHGDRKCLLLLHDTLMVSNSDYLNSLDESNEIDCLPSNVSPAIVPIQKNISMLFKTLYKKYFFQELLSKHQTNVVLSVNWTMMHCVETISRAWDFVSLQILHNVWNQLMFKDLLLKNIHDLIASLLGEITVYVCRIKNFNSWTKENVRNWMEKDSADHYSYHISGDVVAVAEEDEAESSPKVIQLLDLATVSSSDVSQQIKPRNEDVLNALDLVSRYLHYSPSSDQNDMCAILKIRYNVENEIQMRH